MRVVTFILSLALCLVSAPAAAEWTFFQKNQNGTEFFVDFSTYKKTPARRAWFLQNFASRDQFGNMSAKVLQEADCREDKYRGISWQFYKGQMGDGGLSSSDNTPGEWVYASPGSVGEEIIKFLCGR